jgi:alpha-glucuronidase
VNVDSESRLWLGMLVALALVVALLASAPLASAATPEDTYSGSQMWLHYVPVGDPTLLTQYRASATTIIVDNADQDKVYRHTTDLHMEAGSVEKLEDTSLDVARDELVRGLGGLLDQTVPVQASSADGIPNGAVIVGTRDSSPAVSQYLTAADLAAIGSEGYIVRTVTSGSNKFTVIAGNTEVGALYGTFAFLRLIQTEKPIANLNVASSPKVKSRHLDNWETTRLYAGNNAAGTGGLNGENGTIFDFAATGVSAARNLPVILDRYIVVARALASVGINGIEINLVNADNVYLTTAYIAKEAALADALRPYGIKISVAINYTAPTDSRFAPDTLTNAQLDPTSAAFRGWWSRKATQIHDSIPDFMGFTVKANSEGQPGPEDFGYDQGDGANGLAAALAPLGMKVFWRTFVYDATVDEDRLKRAYLTFGYINDEPQPDGTTGRFADNVLLQTKNGPLDYQAREPFNPMFGRLDNTSQALELEITQEYTGQNIMLDYLGPMWEEALKSDTYATDRNGVLLPKRLMGNIVDGSAQGQSETAMVGVANLGNADDLTGNHFSAANLYAFGRLAWDWTQTSKDIADDWTRMTWGNDDHIVNTIVKMMMGSREAVASYETPLGIAHQMSSNAHYPPGPSEWVTEDDQSPVYFNKADSAGLGYDRSRTGSDFVDQYFPTVANEFNNIATTPDNLLMWFHHVPWNYPMKDGKPFWDDLVYRYQMGVQYVTWMRETWDSLQPYIGARRFSEVKGKLATHETDASNWRDTSVNYWKEFSGQPIPTDHGPLSAKIVVNGKQIGGFNLSSASYTIPVTAGASPAITSVIPADPAASYQIVSQASALPGQAVVKVTKEDFFGPLVKNYVFNFVNDTTLRTLRVNGTQPASFKPDVLSYNALLPAGLDTIAKVDAVANDPAATVTVDQATSPTGQAKVTVTSGTASTVYTVNLDSTITGSDEFTAPSLGSQWQFLRPDDSKWHLGNGSLVITSQTGDLQGNTNTAKNVALEDVNGDWTEESKLVFSRPLANNNEQGGIIAYNSDNNYVKLAWEMGSSTAPINKLHVVLIREQNATATTTQVQGNDAQSIVGADGSIWLRLAKSGSTYKAYYSNDGSVWRFMGSTTLNVEPAKAGLVAFNRAGTSTDLNVAFDYFHIASQGDPVPSAFTETGGTVGGTVPATLSLSLGPAASFGAFTPGVDRDYNASMTATVTSTAGDAALAVADPSPSNTGRLVNGAFALAQPVQAQATSAAGSGSAFAPVGGAASPTTLLTYPGPTSNDAVTIGFKQTIGRTEALRTGGYGKTLTFTLSTTTP